MDPKIVILSEVSKWKKNTIWRCLYVASKKKWTYLQNENKRKYLENHIRVTRGEGSGGGIDREFEIDMYTRLYLK